MSAPHAQTIIKGYLRRLDDELTALPRERRSEIVADIEAHIAHARSDLPAETDADLLNVLDRLGDPAEIAHEARERFGVVETPQAGPRELAAMLLLGPGNFAVPVLSWLAGAVLIWRSPCWTDAEKRRGAFIPVAGVLVGPVLALILSLVVVRGQEPSWIGPVLAPVRALLIASPLASTVYLGVRLGRRLPSLAVFAAAALSFVIVVPCVLAMLPIQTQGFINILGSTRCGAYGAFYGTEEYGGGLGGRAHFNVGFCADGNKVRIAWGPDCPVATYGPMALAVNECKAIPQPGGGVVLDLSTSGRATTSTYFTQGRGSSWIIQPDGSLVSLDP